MITKRRKFVTRFLPGLFTGLLLLSGCSQDDVSDVPAGSRAIGFRAQGGMSSLKATTTGADYIQSFVVSAHYGDDWTSETGKYLLRGTTVYRGEDDKWTYSPQAYFPTTDEGAVEFFAYSPSGSKNVETGLKDAATADQTITYNVPSPTGSATTQEDLLVARTGVLQVNNAYPGTVSLQFRHALSRILVKAVSTLDKEVSVTVTGLTLRNLHSKGTLNLKDVPDADADAWDYAETVTDADDPDDVYVKWDAPSVLSNYSYSLPESGVSVSDAPKYVTGADQGIFILPQTTEKPGTNSPKENVVDDEEFGLSIAYSINGIAAADSAYVQFGDLNGISTAGVTFENGRQYVLNLTFGAGSGSGTDPDINIGAKVSFEDIDVDPYPDKDIQVPLLPTYWAASNIYFLPDDGEDGTSDTGVLTFAESGTGKEGYQGVYFKWGSLIGIDAGGDDNFDEDGYLFVPDLSTGTYTRVKVSDVSDGSAYLIGTAGTWSGSGGDSDDWAMIAYADESVIDDTVDDRNDARLTDRNFVTTATNYKDYTGDICKFLSKHKGTSGGGLTKDWVMPTSRNFGEPTENYLYDDPGSVYSKAGNETTDIIAGDTNGIGGTLWGVNLSYALNAPVFLPVSGACAHNGQPHVGAQGFYWSSSASGTGVYYLNFYTFTVAPNTTFTDRTDGMSIRCVREW